MTFFLPVAALVCLLSSVPSSRTSISDYGGSSVQPSIPLKHTFTIRNGWSTPSKKMHRDEPNNCPTSTPVVTHSSVGNISPRVVLEGGNTEGDGSGFQLTRVGLYDLTIAGSMTAQTHAFIAGYAIMPSATARAMRFNLTYCQRRPVYNFTVDYIPNLRPDGVQGPQVLGINGQFPCPIVDVTEGEYLVINVINKIPRHRFASNTSLHWHGLLQKGSCFHDGVNHITQCPIKSGSRRSYHFNLEQSGTFWYHSHLKSQYTEGLWGSFIIRPKDPKPFYFDRRRIIQLSDWYHTTAEENEDFYINETSKGGPPYPFSVLMNGMGRFNCSLTKRSCDPDRQFRPVFRIQPPTPLTQLFGRVVNTFQVINSASWASFNLTIDHHTLEVVEVDGNFLSPSVMCDALHISPGQRYAFILHPKLTVEPGHQFLIRADLRKELLFLAPDATNINPNPNGTIGELTGVLRYVENDEVYPNITSERFSWYEPILPLRPNLANPRFFSDLNATTKEELPMTVDVELTLNLDFHNGIDNIRRGSFDMRPFVQPSTAPLIAYMLNGESYPPGVQNHFINLDQVVEVVINNPLNGSHPIHLHGHFFHVMAEGREGDGVFNRTNEKHNITTNGVVRDTAVVHGRSHLVLRFRANNPGVWVMHCHVDWHALSGMMVVFTIGGNEARQRYAPMLQDIQNCEDHNIMNAFRGTVPPDF